MKPHHTPLKVYPKKWNTNDPSMINKDWEIRYTYFHPSLPSDGELIRFKGMNHSKDLIERQELTKSIIKKELDQLKKGFNPVTEKYENVDENFIAQDTSFLSALDIAIKSFSGESSTIEDYENSLKHIKKYAKKLSLDLKSICDISKGDMKQLLIAMKNDKHSNYRVNKTRSHLSKFFSHFTELDIFEVNFIEGISILEWNPEPRQIIRSSEDWEKFHKIKDLNLNEYVFLFIFLYSGCRFEEMIKVKKEDVEINKSYFWITVKKGGEHHREMRAINLESWKYWKEIYDSALPNQYMFSYGRRPNDKQISANSMYDAAAKYLRLVGLNITGYALKHTFINLISKNYGINVAKEAAGHTTIKTTIKYALDYQEHQVEKNKNLKINI